MLSASYGTGLVSCIIPPHGSESPTWSLPARTEFQKVSVIWLGSQRNWFSSTSMKIDFRSGVRYTAAISYVIHDMWCNEWFSIFRVHGHRASLIGKVTHLNLNGSFSSMWNHSRWNHSIRNWLVSSNCTLWTVSAPSASDIQNVKCSTVNYRTWFRLNIFRHIPSHRPSVLCSLSSLN
jgi:hypothetical protein